MYEIDKKLLGAFIAELRKEKGFTQKELAEKLFLSDKAISKWETGVSIPDTTLLVPLADLLEVTVTELLTYQRIPKNTSIDAEKVEKIIKATVSYSEEEQLAVTQQKKKWMFAYIICLIISAAELIFCHIHGYITENLLTLVGICAGFGGYFCIFAKQKLPTYYDDNCICLYSDGMFRMNIPGVKFNNSNWPRILQALRIWSVVSVVLYPAFHILMMSIIPVSYAYIGGYILLALTLASMFIPIYVIGKKYE